MTDEDRKAFEAYISTSPNRIDLARDGDKYIDPYIENHRRTWMNARARLAAVTKQRDELLKALRAVVVDGIYQDEAEARYSGLVAEIEKEIDFIPARWITIKPDGSNLPEHVEGAEWYCAWRGVSGEMCYDWEVRLDDTTPQAPMGTLAYWSAPSVKIRPFSIPAYQPEQEQDQ